MLKAGHHDGQEKEMSKRTQATLVGRGLAIARQHPEFIIPYLRLTLHKEFLVHLERRLRNGHASLPVRIQIHPTRRCNLKCLTCIQHRHSPLEPIELPWYDSNRELSLKEWTRFLDQAVKFRPWINISGGEPMLYAHFDGLILAAKDRALPVEINTNGTLMADQADFIVQNGVTLVSVSIDGPEDVHDLIRGGKGLFRRSMEGIQALLEARHNLMSLTPIVQIACTISKANLAYLEDMVPLALGIGADVLLFQHTDFNTFANIEKHNQLLAPENASVYGLKLFQPSVPRGEYYESEIGPEDIPMLRQALDKVKGRANGKIKVFVSPTIKPDNMGSYYLDLDYPGSKRCFGLWTTLRVLPDGTVSPCLHIKAGNITEASISDIWNGTVMQNFRRIVAKRLFPGCARCCHRQYSPY